MDDIIYNVAMHSSNNELKLLYQTSHRIHNILDKHFWLIKIKHDHLFIPKTLQNTLDINWLKIYNTITLIQDNINEKYNFLVVIGIHYDKQTQLSVLLQSYNLVVPFDIMYIQYINNNITIFPVPGPIGPFQNAMKSITFTAEYQTIVDIIYEAYMNGIIIDFTKI